MGRQAAASRNAQKWQVAGGRAIESTPDAPSEDEHGGSTRMPSSGGSDLDAPPAAPKDSSAVDLTTRRRLTKEEMADRARWADVESDGEEVEVFHGKHRNATQAEGWATVPGKKPKNTTKPAQKTRTGKADLPPPPAPPAEAPRKAAYKQPESVKSTPYRPPNRQAAVREDHYGWEASSWGNSSRGGNSWDTHGKRGGSTWEEDSWGSKVETNSMRADFRKKGGKEKNESFKRGPQVSVNMDRSRLAW